MKIDVDLAPDEVMVIRPQGDQYEVVKMKQKGVQDLGASRWKISDWLKNTFSFPEPDGRPRANLPLTDPVSLRERLSRCYPNSDTLPSHVSLRGW